MKLLSEKRQPYEILLRYLGERNLLKKAVKHFRSRHNNVITHDQQQIQSTKLQKVLYHIGLTEQADGVGQDQTAHSVQFHLELGRTCEAMFSSFAEKGLKMKERLASAQKSIVTTHCLLGTKTWQSSQGHKLVYIDSFINLFIAGAFNYSFILSFICSVFVRSLALLFVRAYAPSFAR